MNKYEFAISLIRAPWAKRLTDRSFILAVAAVAIGLYLFHQKAIGGEALAQLVGATWGVWILADKGKDAVTINGAMKSDVPDTVNAGGDVRLGDAPLGASLGAATNEGVIDNDNAG